MQVPEGRPDAKMWWRTRPYQSARLPVVSSSDETAPRLRQRLGLMEIGVGPTGRGGFLQNSVMAVRISAFRPLLFRPRQRRHPVEAAARYARSLQPFRA